VRFRSKPLAALSILLVLVGTLAGWHAPDDSDDYAAPALHHHADHNARFATPTHPITPEHCVFCHWLRALGNGAPVATQRFHSQRTQFIRLGDRDAFVRTAALLALPSRAPPLV
jgi:hypothetical protein